MALTIVHKALITQKVERRVAERKRPPDRGLASPIVDEERLSEVIDYARSILIGRRDPVGAPRGFFSPLRPSASARAARRGPRSSDRPGHRAVAIGARRAATPLGTTDPSRSQGGAAHRGRPARQCRTRRHRSARLSARASVRSRQAGGTRSGGGMKASAATITTRRATRRLDTTPEGPRRIDPPVRGPAGRPRARTCIAHAHVSDGRSLPARPRAQVGPRCSCS